MSTTDTTPTNWPPQPGDIWTDQDGDDWFTVHLTHHELDDGEAVILVRASQGDTVEPDGEEPDDVRRWWGPLALAYRHDDPTVRQLAEKLRNLPTVYMDGVTAVGVDVLRAALDDATAQNGDDRG